MVTQLSIEDLKKLSLEKIKALNPHKESDLEHDWFNDDVTEFITDEDYSGLYNYLTDTDYEI